MEDDSPYDISIARVSEDVDVSDQNLVVAIEATLRRHRISTASISVALVDDPHIAELNETHLHHEGSTDVLTFDLCDQDAQADDSRNRHVEGEIVVSVDTATREAQKRGHDIEAELALYVVHGTLHLLGYDDNTPDAAERMHLIEDDVLSFLGLGPIFGRLPR